MTELAGDGMEGRWWTWPCPGWRAAPWHEEERAHRHREEECWNGGRIRLDNNKDNKERTVFGLGSQGEKRAELS